MDKISFIGLISVVLETSVGNKMIAFDFQKKLAIDQLSSTKPNQSKMRKYKKAISFLCVRSTKVWTGMNILA
jgi:hypothetical protein